MANFEVVMPPGSEKTYERFHFAPATRVGNTLYCSGVIGADGSKVPEDVGEEFTKAFESLSSVLEAAGGTLADVVEMTSFHVGLNEHLGAFIAAKDVAISEPYPAWTAIGCTELAMPGARVEIRATAVFGD